MAVQLSLSREQRRPAARDEEVPDVPEAAQRLPPEALQIECPRPRLRRRFARALRRPGGFAGRRRRDRYPARSGRLSGKEYPHSRRTKARRLLRKCYGSLDRLRVDKTMVTGQPHQPLGLFFKNFRMVLWTLLSELLRLSRARTSVSSAVRCASDRKSVV